MSFTETALLGALAGFTIFLGLPLGRVTGLSPKVRAFLSMASTGILFFLLFEIFHQLSEPIEDALLQATSAGSGYDGFVVLLLNFVVGLGLGLVGLVTFERAFMRRSLEERPKLSPYRLSLMVAAGIGLHNFSEGLAIGQSSARAEIAFATLLIIGFALHNATEGFGIVGPLAGEKASWGFLALAGLIGGGPTFIGTMLGFYFVSPPLFIFSLSIAAGALIYIIGQMFDLNRNMALRAQVAWGLFAGLMIAYLTELILAVAGF